MRLEHCIGWIVLIVVVAALCGGITVNGRHYELELRRGVRVIDRPALESD